MLIALEELFDTVARISNNSSGEFIAGSHKEFLMERQNQSIFKLKTERAVFVSIFGVLVTCSGLILCFIAAFIIGLSLPIRSFVIFMAILALVYGFYFIYSSWTTYLRITRDGFYYFQPFYSVFCKWEDLTGLQFTKDFLFVTYSEQAKEYRSNWSNFFPLSNLKGVPLHYFVRNWLKSEDWRKDIILRKFSEAMPNIETVIAQ